MPTVLFPTEVPVDEAAIDKLIRTYRNAYRQILKEIDSATAWGAANRRQILDQIEAILQQLGDDVGRYIETEIPKQYIAGSNDAVAQLKAIGVDPKFSIGFNRIHQQAIAALVSDTASAFGESLTGVNRSAKLLMNQATKQAITQSLATAQIQGTARQEIAKQLKFLIREQGLDALVDKAGHSWTLDRYTDMLIRTKSSEARNTGLANRMLQNGNEFVQVSDHNSDHKACAVWEGKILSLTGKTKQINGVQIHTVVEAQEAGLFHPNCKHAINAINIELAQQTRAYDPETKKYGKPGADLAQYL